MRQFGGSFYFMPYLYILYSETIDKYYIGHTTQLPEERLAKHLTDHDGFTSKCKDWVIMYRERYEQKSDAHKREIEIKKWKSRKRIEGIIKQGM